MNLPVKKTYLNNKVHLETLPKEADGKGRFITSDERGIVSLFISNDPVEFVEYAEFKNKGVKRGFHYHKNYTEYIYVSSGKLLFVGKAVKSGESVELIAETGDLLTIAPNIAHGLLSLKASSIIAAGKGENPFKDRHVFKTITFSTDI